jgi:hypothetical protein
MDPVAVYGATLSTVIALVGAGRFIYVKWSDRREKKKVHVSFHHMITNDPKTKERVDIAFILFANLGESTIVLKEVEYFGDGSRGSPGWYQEPEATHGIMKRVLPAVLKPGDVVELPLFYLAFFDHAFHRMVVRDIENHEYEVPPSEVEGMRRRLGEKEASSRLQPSGPAGG